MGGALDGTVNWDAILSVAEFLAVLALVIVMVRRVFRRRGHPHTIGPGASGAVYELLNEDKRRAIELIVEERTGERDPEDRDGSMDDLGAEGYRVRKHPE